MIEQNCQKCGAPLTSKKCDYCGTKNKKEKKASEVETIEEEQLELFENLEDHQLELTPSVADEQKELTETIADEQPALIESTNEEQVELIEPTDDEPLESIEPTDAESVNDKQPESIETTEENQTDEVEQLEPEFIETVDEEQSEPVEVELEPTDELPQSKRKKKLASLFGWGIMVIFAIVLLVSHFNQEEPDELRYFCTFETSPLGVEMVVIIESRGLAITRWIEEYTFPRQVYINQNWGQDWDLTDDDIREWYEGPENVTDIDGTYWEIVSVDDEFVVIRFVYHYEVMSREDLDELWEPNFSGVNRHSAIRVLRDDGGICVPE